MQRKTIHVTAVPDSYEDGYHFLTPKEAPRRAQTICNSGIFNLMGIESPGEYTITCTKIEKRRKRAAVRRNRRR